MKKTILINKNKILILEDAVQTLANEKTGIFDDLKNIISGLGNISSGLVNDIKSVIQMSSNFLNTEKFNKALESGRERRVDLNSDWNSIINNLGIEKPVEEFLAMTNPAAAIANAILKSNLSTRITREKGVLDDIAGIGKPITDVSGNILKFIKDNSGIEWGDNDDKIDSSNKSSAERILNGRDATLYFYRWETNLSDENREKLNKWYYENPNKQKTILKLIEKGSVKRAIRELEDSANLSKEKSKPVKKEKVNSNYTITIRNNMIFLNEEESKQDNIINKIYDELNKQSVIKVIEKIITDNLVKNIQKQKGIILIDELDQDLENLKKMMQKFEDFLKNDKEEIEGFDDFNNLKADNDDSGKKTILSKLISVFNFLNKFSIEEAFGKDHMEELNKLKEKDLIDKLREVINKKEKITNGITQLKSAYEEKINSTKEELEKSEK